MSLKLQDNSKNASFVSLFDTKNSTLLTQKNLNKNAKFLNKKNDDFLNLNDENLATQNPKKFTKSKNLGQVFTPTFIVDLMLNLSEFKSLCGLKILEAGCGEGAFLVQILRRYIKEFLEKSNDLNRLQFELEKNLIGIDIDDLALQICFENLDKIASEFGLKNVKWKLIKGDFLTLYAEFKGQVDLIIGNPPYIRVHNLNENARKFTRGGMSDLFLIFFELGFECLKNGGELIFISPSSWLNSKAGASFRAKIQATQNLRQIIDFSHEKIFEKIITYSLVSAFKKGFRHDFVKASEFKNKRLENERNISYKELFLPNKEIFLGQAKFKELLNLKPLAVKNGFATLCDEFFVGDFSGLTYPKIPILKASNGKWLECIYPYDKNGDFLSPSGAVLKRYKEYEKRLKSRDLRGQGWLEFGRRQAIKDTYKRKIAFNTLIKGLKDLRICEVKAGEGVFSGLYIVSDLPLTCFEKALRNDEFLDFVRALRKYKNGGYYSFSSSDLGKFLAYKMDKLDFTPKFKYELEFVDCQGLTSSKLAMMGREQKFTPLQKSVNFL
ncbi:Eco57I restriction-modification methylase domain-containing protein [Campylobacter troglodytis]|uniref:Eco57I restriction-modification methylase domain-containing protein n=1 Tax=Campylobacter troglodytis TaxID=654363 RepID=UPI001158EB91|nr:Eco57I restriction-modification methylase domain-containing protein [Campylobacter troglodytis]TQR54622.1 hypothetical protein DMC01_10070 [Campylobacter troglodytis]